MSHEELHKSHRAGWLRAAVMGANDGIVSTASLIIGVSAANVSANEIVVAGLAGLVAGAMSMAAGEYVSVSSQADIEKADLDMERHSLKYDAEFELLELTSIYERRGLDSKLARQVAMQLTAHDALDAHARDELGFFDRSKARPLQAASYSAATFFLGAILPLLTAWLCPLDYLIPAVALVSLISLALLGTLSAIVGGAVITIAVYRVVFWGALAMIATAAVGRLFGV
jgi:VIT1/CCC1 family predicted Fe2+/Mn2+ transporter